MIWTVIAGQSALLHSPLEGWFQASPCPGALFSPVQLGHSPGHFFQLASHRSIHSAMENATQCDGIVRMRLVGMTILHINVYYIYLWALWLSKSVLNSILEHHFQRGNSNICCSQRTASPGRTCDFIIFYWILKALRQNVPKFHLRKSGWGLMNGNPNTPEGEGSWFKTCQILLSRFRDTHKIYQYIYIHKYIHMATIPKTFLKLYHIEVFELHKSPTILVSPFGQSGQTKHASAVVIPLL